MPLSDRENANTQREIMLAGAAAAFTVDLLVYPLDTIKTRLQSGDYVATYAPSSSSSSSSAHRSAVAGLCPAAASSPYALRGLYQGVGSVVLATLPAVGVFFSTYEWAKAGVAHALPAAAAAPAVVHALASGTAELASCLVLTPAEVIKQNAQMIQTRQAAPAEARAAPTPRGGQGARAPARSTSLQALRRLLRAEGGPLRRLRAGYTALAARNLPFTALQFPLFEALRARLGARWLRAETGHPPLAAVGAVSGLSAGAAGALAAVVTTPTDVVKTRMMLGADADKPPTAAGPSAQRGRRPSAREVAARVYREHGVRGLFRGGAFRAGWTFVGSGLYLGTYEVAKAWLRGRQGSEAGGADG